MLKTASMEKTWDFIQRLDRASDERTIESILHEIVCPLGFTSVFGGVVPTKVVPPQEIASRTLLQRMPIGWSKRYNQRGYLFRDPIVERLLIDRRPFFWKDAYASSAFESNVDLIRGESSEFGLRGGFVVPISLLDCNTATVSFGGAETDLSPETQCLLGFVASCAIGQLLKRRCSAHRARGRISAREYDCLLWAAEGKTDWEIAVILGISRPTVTKHILSAREKLGAVTKAHAIAIALRKTIIP